MMQIWHKKKSYQRQGYQNQNNIESSKNPSKSIHSKVLNAQIRVIQ